MIALLGYSYRNFRLWKAKGDILLFVPKCGVVSFAEITVTKMSLKWKGLLQLATEDVVKIE